MSPFLNMETRSHAVDNISRHKKIEDLAATEKLAFRQSIFI
jgi:hypothetical protein